MRNEREHSRALLFCSKGRIWMLPVRLPGNRSHVCVRCIAKSGYMMANTAFVNVSWFSAVFVRSPGWLKVNWQDNECQSEQWENSLMMRLPVWPVALLQSIMRLKMYLCKLKKSLFLPAATHTAHHTEESLGFKVVMLHMRFERSEKFVKPPWKKVLKNKSSWETED